MDFNNQLKSHQKNYLYVLMIILSIFLIVLTIFFFIGIQNKVKQGKYIGQEIESKNTITVSDSAEKYVKPDLAMISFSVVNEAKTVEKAMEDNTEMMNNLISDIQDQGIEEKDIKTTTYSIYPRYEYREMAIDPSGRRVLAGYEIRQSVQVKIRDLDMIGNVIQAATNAGANQTGGLSFSVDNDEEYKQEARAEAIQKAKQKAEKIANALGVDLVRIVDFNESGQTPRYDFVAKSQEYGIGAGGAAPEIQTGENKIEVNVSITYEIN